MNKLILLVCTVLMAGCTATTKEELTESGLKRSENGPVRSEEQEQDGSVCH